MAVLGAEEYPFRVYVADVDAGSVTLAWGKAEGTTANTIGRGAPGMGEAAVEIAGRTVKTGKSWVRVEGLKADQSYPYRVAVNGVGTGGGTARTWPVKADKLTYFVIGDFGTGQAGQRALAVRMEEERVRREQSGNPVRFVLAVGDNIYGKLSASGAADRDWEKKFFAPYQETLRAVPFKAILGNHDGNESERAGDLEACLDNFFMPGRWYRFEYASMVEFFLLDTTRNQIQGPVAPVYLPGSEQSKWLERELGRKPLPWRVVSMHHPMFTAGPNHGSFLKEGQHWFEVMKAGGVQAVFSGHEHNLQFSERSAATGNMQFVVSGAGGELRRSSVLKAMGKNSIAAWANQYHFLAVTIEGRQMTVEPVGLGPVNLRDGAGKAATQPVRFLSNR